MCVCDAVEQWCVVSVFTFASSAKAHIQSSTAFSTQSTPRSGLMCKPRSVFLGITCFYFGLGSTFFFGQLQSPFELVITRDEHDYSITPIFISLIDSEGVSYVVKKG